MREISFDGEFANFWCHELFLFTVEQTWFWMSRTLPTILVKYLLSSFFSLSDIYIYCKTGKVHDIKSSRTRHQNWFRASKVREFPILWNFIFPTVQKLCKSEQRLLRYWASKFCIWYQGFGIRDLTSDSFLDIPVNVWY